MPERTYPHGAQCWVDLETPELEASKAFYSGLFGWTLENAMPPDAPGEYFIATIDGEDVAAITPSEGDGPARWNTYVAVDDADASAAKVAEAGGTVTIDPVDAGPGGRMAACIDPSGAEFRLWQARARIGAQRVNDAGAWNFSALHSTDPSEQADFYGAVFGWELDNPDEMPGGTWRLPGYGEHLQAHGDPEIFERQEEVGAPPGFADVIAVLSSDDQVSVPFWQVIFAVADRDEAASRAGELGAEVLATVDGGWTKEAEIRDPAGALITLSQFTPPGG